MRNIRGSYSNKIEREKIEELFKKLCFCDLKVSCLLGGSDHSVELNVKGFTKEEHIIKISTDRCDFFLNEYDLYECYQISVPNDGDEIVYVEVFNEAGDSILRVESCSDDTDQNLAFWIKLARDLRFK